MTEPTPRPINLVESGMNQNGNFIIGQPTIPSVLRDEVGDIDFELKPILSAGEIETIRTQWEQETVLEQQRKLQLHQEELRLQELMASDRGQYLIQKYENNKDKKSFITQADLQTQDDVIVILRHAFGQTMHFEYQREVMEDPDIRGKLLTVDRNVLEQTKLRNIVRKEFKTLGDAIATSFPAFDFHQFEFSRTSKAFWEGDNAKDDYKRAIKWVIEHDLGIEKKDPLLFREKIKSLPLQRTFTPYGLIHRIEVVGYKNLFQALADTYPELKLKEWEFKTSWRGESGRQLVKDATRWLIEERLGFSPEDQKFREKLTRIQALTFIKAGLSGMLGGNSEFKSHIQAIVFTYGDLNLREEEFSRFPAGYWRGKESLNRAREHTKRLVEEELGFSSEDPKFRENMLRISKNDFDSHGLATMLIACCGASPQKAILLTYPELDLREWEFDHVPRNYWPKNNYENVGKAVRWVFEEKLGISPNSPNFRDIILSTKREMLTRFHLQGITALGFKWIEILKLAYPELKLTDEEYFEANKHRRKISEKKEHISPEEANEWLRNLLQEGEDE